MKTNFLLVMSALLLLGMSLKAQITLPKEWNFANDSVTWPTNPTGVTTDPTTIDGLTFWHTAAGGGTPSNLGTVTYKERTYGAVTYNRKLSLGNYAYWGAFNPSNPKPNQRFMSFDVPGSCIVKVLLASDWNDITKIYITDGKTGGTAFTDSITTAASNTTTVTEGSVIYKGGATTLYIGGASGVALTNYLSIKVEPYVTSQNYEWKFGLDQETFPLSAGHAVNTTIAPGLTLYPGSTTNAGEVTEQTKSFNGANYTQAFDLAGAGLWGSDFDTGATTGTPTLMMPRQRYLAFNVSGNCIITAHLMLRWNGVGGRIFVTDGKKLIGTMNVSSNTNIVEQSVTYTDGEDKTLYVFGDGATYFFYLKVEPPSATNIVEKTAALSKTDIVSVSYYDFTGRQVSLENKGILLCKTVYENGLVETKKIINN